MTSNRFAGCPRDELTAHKHLSEELHGRGVLRARPVFLRRRYAIFINYDQGGAQYTADADGRDSARSREIGVGR